jgi:hypothetical protein
MPEIGRIKGKKGQKSSLKIIKKCISLIMAKRNIALLTFNSQLKVFNSIIKNWLKEYIFKRPQTNFRLQTPIEITLEPQIVKNVLILYINLLEQ